MTTIRRKRQPRRGICPRCGNEYTLLATGVLPRHGFTAHGVTRSGATSGFHIGGHGLDHPIGTEPGNKLALDQASIHDARVTYLASLPPHSPEDVERSAFAEMRACLNRRMSGVLIGADLDRNKVMTDARFAAYRHWLSEDSMKSRRNRLMRERETAIQEHTDMTKLLRRLVERNPA